MCEGRAAAAVPRLQLTGSQFGDESGWLGNDIATFPDYPAEIRAPVGTVAGVSGFQIHFGKSGIHSPGDIADVLIAMNPAALKANLKSIRKQGIVITDSDSFDQKRIEKAEYTSNPFEDGSLDDYELIKVPISSLTKKAISSLELGLDNKSVMRCVKIFLRLVWLIACSIVHWPKLKNLSAKNLKKMPHW